MRVLYEATDINEEKDVIEARLGTMQYKTPPRTTCDF